MTPGPLPAGSAPGAIADIVRAVLTPLLPTGTRAVVAVSGGADSAGLAVAVRRARPDLDLVAVHVRHGLRDDAADAKAASGLAQHLGLDYREERVEVLERGEGPEAAARAARYEALERVAAEVGAAAVLTGHTAEDQAETVLLNVLRGAGLRGLGGMAVARALAPPAAPPAASSVASSGGPISLVRPLLDVRRADVRVLAAGLATVEDPTNADPALRRSRVRHEVLPVLADVFTDPVGALGRMALLARTDDGALETLAGDAAVAVMWRWGGVVAVPVAELGLQPPAVAARILRRAVAEVRGDLEGLTAADLARLSVLAPGQALHLSKGVVATSGGGWIAFAPAGLAGLRERPLPVPGTLALEEIGLVLHTGHETPAPAIVAEGPPGAREPCATLLTGRAPFTVRARRPGDRIRLPGGTRSLQDLFVDAGVPRPVRDLVPVVVDAGGTVRWVAGLAAAHDPGAPPGPALWLASS